MPPEDNGQETRTNAQLGGMASSEHQAVERYLRFLAGDWKPPESKVDTAAWEAKIKDEPRLAQKVKLIAELERLESPVNKRKAMEVEEALALGGFLRHGESFSVRYGITYKAWRAMGVPPAVLRQMNMVPEYAPNPESKRTGGGYGNPGVMRNRGPEPTIRQRLLKLMAASDRGVTTRDVRDAEPALNTGSISGGFGGLRKLGLAEFNDATQRWYLTPTGIATVSELRPPEESQPEETPPGHTRRTAAAPV